MLMSVLLTEIENVDTYMVQTWELCENVGDQELTDVFQPYAVSMAEFLQYTT